MSTVEQKTVATPTTAVVEMQQRVCLVRALVEGTEAMRRAGTKYLPKEKAESPDAYAARLKRSTLFNATGKTVEDMTGKVFYKPIAFGDDVPEKLKSNAENVDGVGRHINVFAKDVFADCMQAGIGYIFIDMPVMTPLESNRLRSVAESSGIQPYFVYVPVESLRGWKSAVVNGKESLTQVRYSECVTVTDGPWHEKEIEQIRVLTLGKWETYRQNDKGDWSLYESGTSTITDQIPFVPVYLNRTGFMTGKPPLEKLAELNVAHWQSASDQRNILHVARVPILFGAGFANDSDMVVGASNMFRSSNPDAKLTYVEHTGKAIDAGRNDLQDLISQMESMGLQLLISKPGQTATGEVRDDVKENSPLAAMATALQDALETAFGFMAQYENLGKDSGGSLIVNKDFGIQVGALDVQQIIDGYRSGLIDAETAINELIRRGFLADSTDPEVVLDRLGEEMAKKRMDLGNSNNDNVGAVV